MSTWHSDGGRLDRSTSFLMLLEHHCTQWCHPFGCVLLSQPCVQTELLHPSLSCRECRHIFALMWRRQSAYILQGCLQKPCFHLANQIFFIIWAIDFISQIRYSSSCLPILQHINHQCHPPAKGWHFIRSSLSPFTISEQPLRFTQSLVQFVFWHCMSPSSKVLRVPAIYRAMFTLQTASDILSQPEFATTIISERKSNMHATTSSVSRLTM